MAPSSYFNHMKKEKHMNSKTKKNKDADVAEVLPGESRKHLPKISVTLFLIAAVCIPIYLVCLISPTFSDFFNRYFSSSVRAVLAYLTGWIPFSLAEFLLLMVPVILVYLILFGVRKNSDSWHDVFVFCGKILSVLAAVMSIFLLGFAPAYRGTTLDKKLGIARRDVSAEELYETANLLVDKINREAKQIVYENGGFSVMPYNYGEMNDKLLEAYDKACDKYDFVQRLHSRLKPVIMSEAMSYTHITGVYTFFTGEANINVAFPDYTIPYTAAHELSHQRGIAREDEANFMAFLVCIESDDAYIRYSGYLNLYEYVASALSSASPDLYRNVYMRLSIDVKNEMSAFSEFFNRYRHSVASEVTDAVNNTFLIIHGTEGTKSYGMVVDLAVAYYCPPES